jgi:hypothetical protein
MPSRWVWAAPFVAALSMGCSSPASDASGGGGNGTTTSTSATTGVSTGTGMACPDGKLCLDPPNPGFQIQSVGEVIQPGSDIEYCEVVQLPGKPTDEYFVNRFEVGMTNYSHHLIVAAAIPGSATEKALTPGMKKKCTGPDVFGGDLYSVTGSQHPYHDERYPDGVGKKFQGGQMMIFDYHYFNSSTAPVQARAAVNFHTVDKAKVTKLAHTFGFYNLSIFIPPNTEKSFTKQCTFTQDVMVSKVVRHTHKWGTDFSVDYFGGPNDGQHIWTTSSYEDTDHVLDPPVLMKKGTGFKFTCNFKNTTANLLKFGLTASDEMCILFGTWYVVNPGDAEAEQQCGF